MDLSTMYMGLRLANPLVASASPLTLDPAAVRKMEDSGVAAVVLGSLFEEQIAHQAEELDFYLQYGADRFPESLTYFPAKTDYKLGPEEYLDHIALLKKTCGLPVIASLNGISTGGWMSYAEKVQQAGADGIELNVYFLPTDTRLTAQRVEEVYFSALAAVKSAVEIPVAMKLSPYFSATAAMASRLALAGADALVLFNRFYQPDIDIHKLEVAPRLELSTSADSRLPLRWIAILYGRVRASLAITSGIHTAEDAAKAIMAGADAVMMCSALLRNGVEHIGKVKAGLVEFMQQAGYDSVSQMKGILSQKSCPEPAVFERANYMKTLQGFGQTATRE